MFDETIRYEILYNGTCSYCGKEADLMELPDGSLERSEVCEYCEAYNEELLADDEDE